MLRDNENKYACALVIHIVIDRWNDFVKCLQIAAISGD